MYPTIIFPSLAISLLSVLQLPCFCSCYFPSISYCELHMQGRSALEDHFRNSRFSCDSKDILPLVFDPPRDGTNFVVPTIAAGQFVGQQVHISPQILPQYPHFGVHLPAQVSDLAPEAQTQVENETTDVGDITSPDVEGGKGTLE